MEAFSKWLTNLSYWWILLGFVVILTGLYFLFNAFPRTKKVKLQLLLHSKEIFSVFYYSYGNIDI